MLSANPFIISVLITMCCVLLFRDLLNFARENDHIAYAIAER